LRSGNDLEEKKGRKYMQEREIEGITNMDVGFGRRE
jgi:hypothetical protein